MSRSAFVIGCLVGGLALGSLVVSSAAPATSPRQGITAATEQMRAALQRGDAQALAGFYTEDADLAGQVPLRGRAAIEVHMADLVRRGIRDVRLEEEELFPGNAYSAEMGRAAFYDRTGARVAVLSYMTLWKREGDAWRIHRDVSFPVAIDAAAVARMATGDAAFSVKDTEPFYAVILPMTGSYDQHGEAIGRLAAWLGSSGVQPLGAPFGRYLNSPEQVAEADLRWEVGFPVPAGTEAPAPFEVREIADGEVATAVIRGPHDTTERPWKPLIAWAMQQGYRIVGPAMEIWQEGPKTEMRIAVRK